MHVFARNVQKAISEDIRKSKFCLIVNELMDMTKSQNMAIVMRFVNRN